MDSKGDIQNEIESWLQIVLRKDNIKDLSVNVLGNSEKGDGYMGDIVFVYALGIAPDGSTKDYHLVLKCSKRSQALRATTPVQEAFLNEIYIYETVLPTFTEFQIKRGIKNLFNSVPKCYGTFTSDTMEVIVFQNLKQIGYDLWNKKNPLTRKHIDMVVNEYGKFHAVSVAMKDQQPEKLGEFADALTDIFKKLVGTNDMENLFETTIDEVYDLLKDELEEGVMLKWKNFKQQVHFVLYEMVDNVDGLKVILHGDCWNNNFMYQSANEDKDSPLKVAILDWQVSRFTTPILDLSYFLFACISKDDLQDLDVILANYHKSLSSHLKKLGSDPDTLYPLHQFLDDWKKYSRYGILMSSLIMKICSSDKDEVLDIAQVADNGKDFTDIFLYELKDKANLRNRMQHIVKFVVENELI